MARLAYRLERPKPRHRSCGQIDLRDFPAVCHESLNLGSGKAPRKGCIALDALLVDFQIFVLLLRVRIAPSCMKGSERQRASAAEAGPLAVGGGKCMACVQAVKDCRN